MKELNILIKQKKNYINLKVFVPYSGSLIHIKLLICDFRLEKIRSCLFAVTDY